MIKFAVAFKEKLEDGPASAIFYAKEFSDDLTGRSHNVMVEKIINARTVVFKTQGSLASYSGGPQKTGKQIVNYLKNDFPYIKKIKLMRTH